MSLLFSACKKDNTDPIVLSDGDYLMFGHFYGMCAGEACVEIFRLEDNRLLEDTNDVYPSYTNFYEGNYVALSASQFTAVQDLTSYFPNDLWAVSNRVIGQPDAGDWGGLYVEYSLNGLRQFWLIDTKRDNVPAVYHPFIDKIEEKIALLQ